MFVATKAFAQQSSINSLTYSVLNMKFGVNTMHQVWCSLEEKLLPNTKEKKAQLKKNLYAMTKGWLALEEYIKKFKIISK